MAIERCFIRQGLIRQPDRTSRHAQVETGANKISFIVMGNSNEMCRKILNSPNHAEPCLVAAAKKVLLPTNWVFLHGKAHSDYRRALNVLFTKQALR
jgi:cytochrome P450